MLQSVDRCAKSFLLYSRGRSDASVDTLSGRMTLDWVVLQDLFVFEWLELEERDKPSNGPSFEYSLLFILGIAINGMHVHHL
jgi:hypothetical protein